MMTSESQNYNGSEITTRILTAETWPALEELFGKHGASGGCWCMYWRLPHREFYEGCGEANREAFKALVAEGKPCGILAYVDQAPAGWIAAAPRSDYPALDHSRLLKPVDDHPVWSAPCFFIGRRFRKLGLMGILIGAAEDYARQNGAEILEAYPVDPFGEKKADISVYTGLASTFSKAGYYEAARRKETRPIMRKALT